MSVQRGAWGSSFLLLFFVTPCPWLNEVYFQVSSIEVILTKYKLFPFYIYIRVYCGLLDCDIVCSVVGGYRWFGWIYRIFSNLMRILFTVSEGQKNQMRIRIACGLDSRSWAGFGKNDRAAVRAVRTIQYNHLLFYLLFIIYNIYNLSFIRLAVITHNWIVIRHPVTVIFIFTMSSNRMSSLDPFKALFMQHFLKDLTIPSNIQYYSISLPCRQGAVEGKVRIRIAN